MTPTRWRWSATTASSCSARTSATSAACSAARRDCRSGSATTAASTPRSTSPASSAPRSAWRRTACGRASRSSSPTTCIRPTTRSCRRPPACATAPPATSPRRSSCGCRPAAGSSAARRTARARRRCSPTCAGLKTVVVSNPYDAKGLLIAAIEDDDPVIFLEPKRLYNGPFDGHHDRPIVPWSQHPLGEVPEGHYTIELGAARVHREGDDLTVLTYGTLVHVAEAAAEEQGIDAEIIDLRTLCRSTSTPSSRRCRRPDAAWSLHEATLTSGFGAELSSTVQERVLLSTWKRRSCGCAAGTRRIRTPTSGRTSPGPIGSAGRCGKSCRHERLPDEAARRRRGCRRGRARRVVRRRRRRGHPRIGARRGADRQGDGRGLVAGRRRRHGAARRARRRARRRQRSRRDRDQRAARPHHDSACDRTGAVAESSQTTEPVARRRPNQTRLADAAEHGAAAAPTAERAGAAPPDRRARRAGTGAVARVGPGGRRRVRARAGASCMPISIASSPSRPGAPNAPVHASPCRRWSRRERTGPRCAPPASPSG